MNERRDEIQKTTLILRTDEVRGKGGHITSYRQKKGVYNGEIKRKSASGRKFIQRKKKSMTGRGGGGDRKTTAEKP